jgi:putative membrane protein
VVGQGAGASGALPDETPDEVAHETEPDYRFTLANERTFLAWLRTALSLLAAGVALDQFVPELGAPGLRTALGVGLGALSVLCAVGGLLRWQRVQLAMRRGRPLPVTRSGVVLGVGLAVVGLVVSVLLATGA